MTSNIAEPIAHLAVPIAGLVEDPTNARSHGERNLGAIKLSLEKFGQRQPIIVQKKGMIVRAGNGRLAAAKVLGWTEIAAIVIDEDDMDAVAFAIMDNKSSELATWDYETLGSLVKALDADARALTGFDEKELAEFTRDEWKPPTIDEKFEPGETNSSQTIRMRGEAATKWRQAVVLLKAEYGNALEDSDCVRLLSEWAMR